MFGWLALFAAAPALAFDSKCRAPDGAECEAGPLTARMRWNASDSEHKQIWDRVVSSMGLPKHLLDDVQLRVPSIDATVEVPAWYPPNTDSNTVCAWGTNVWR